MKWIELYRLIGCHSLLFIFIASIDENTKWSNSQHKVVSFSVLFLFLFIFVRQNEREMYTFAILRVTTGTRCEQRKGDVSAAIGRHVNYFSFFFLFSNFRQFS